MNQNLKNIILEELKLAKIQIKPSQYLRYLFLLILYNTLFTYGLNSFDTVGNHSLIISLVFLPSLVSYLMVIELIKVKLNNEKIFGILNDLLATPISICDIRNGKNLAIFLFSLPLAFLSIALVFVEKLFMDNGLLFNSFSIETWLLIFILGPLFLYFLIQIFTAIILKLKHPKIMSILTYGGLIYFIVGLATTDFTVNIIDWNMIGFITLILLVILVLMILISNKIIDKYLKKEDVSPI